MTSKNINFLAANSKHLPKVKLLYSTPLYVLAYAIRKSRDSLNALDTAPNSDELGIKDQKLIKLIMQEKHLSTLEHVYYSFDIQNISRACLIELTRHRIASYTVQSTRYTIKKHKNKDLADLYLSTGDPELDLAIEYSIKKLLKREATGSYSNDELKYLLPEAWLTTLVMSINARSFSNFLALRLESNALDEIRLLAFEMHRAVPWEHQFYLYKDIISKI